MRWVALALLLGAMVGTTDCLSVTPKTVEESETFDQGSPTDASAETADSVGPDGPTAEVSSDTPITSDVAPDVMGDAADTIEVGPEVPSEFDVPPDVDDIFAEEITADPGVADPAQPDAPDAPADGVSEVEGPEEIADVSVDVAETLVVDEGPADHLADALCIPDCTGKVCGPDGCGSYCGFCPYGQVCLSNGTCETICDPKAYCAARACGPDNCYGSCGDCMIGYTCKETTGECIAGTCLPDCTGRECGDDGCGKGGTCGECAVTQICTDMGLCASSPCAGIDPAYNSCSGTKLLKCLNQGLPNELVISKDCSQTLGSDGQTPQVCGFDAWTGKKGCIDKPPCVPKCTDDIGNALECGNGGCVDKADACGVCATGWGCPAFHCRPVAGATCGYIDQVGYCWVDNTLYWCNGDPQNGGTISVQDCSATSKKCAWNNKNGQFACM